VRVVLDERSAAARGLARDPDLLRINEGSGEALGVADPAALALPRRARPAPRDRGRVDGAPPSPGPPRTALAGDAAACASRN
jgi:hypothetical protein